MKPATNPLTALLGRLRSASHPVAVCAHRGDSKHAPENTLAAFRAAIEAGADMIELDIQRTADGELVVIHDAKLERTTDGKGKVRDRTLAEIRRLDAGRWLGEEFGGERVPTLDEVVELLLAHDVVPLVEVKGRFRRIKGIEDPLGAVLRNQAVGDRIALIAHDRHVAEAIRRTCDGAMLSLLTFTKRNARFAARNGFHGVVPYWKSLSVKLIAELHDRELFLSPWTVNRRRDMRRLLDLGVDAIVTDDPALLRDTVDAWVAQRRQTPEPVPPIDDLDLEQLDSDEVSAPSPDAIRLQWIRESGDSGDAITIDDDSDDDDEMDRDDPDPDPRSRSLLIPIPRADSSVGRFAASTLDAVLACDLPHQRWTRYSREFGHRGRGNRIRRIRRIVSRAHPCFSVMPACAFSRSGLPPPGSVETALRISGSGLTPTSSHGLPQRRSPSLVPDLAPNG